MSATLVILAAGMASRYGSQKQTQSFGPSGETIMEYSIYDAIRAGFDRVVFIIREDFADAFKAQIEPKIAGKIKVDYVFQSLNSYVPEGKLPEGRTKPWGTAHALLCCKEKVTEPFAVINADDFYGADAFEKAYQFLQQATGKQWAVIAYHLGNTLSEHGSVSRGVLQVDAGVMTGITERTNVYRKDDEMVYEDETGVNNLPDSSLVSMNMFCFGPDFIPLADRMFADFVEQSQGNIKAEFFIPLVVDAYATKENGEIKVVSTDAKWFGVTYKEDAPIVQDSISALVKEGKYPNNLWA